MVIQLKDVIEAEWIGLVITKNKVYSLMGLSFIIIE